MRTSAMARKVNVFEIGPENACNRESEIWISITVLTIFILIAGHSKQWQTWLSIGLIDTVERCVRFWGVDLLNRT